MRRSVCGMERSQLSVSRRGVATSYHSLDPRPHESPLRTVDRMSPRDIPTSLRVMPRPAAVVDLRAVQTRVEDGCVEEKLFEDGLAQDRLDQRHRIVVSGLKPDLTGSRIHSADVDPPRIVRTDPPRRASAEVPDG